MKDITPTDEAIDDDLDLAEAIINGVCPSCGQSDSHETCIRNTQEILVDDHYEMKADFHPEKKKLLITTHGADKQMSCFEVSCCNADYRFFMHEFARMQESREIIPMVW
jgi:hypothetical protein